MNITLPRATVQAAFEYLELTWEQVELLDEIRKALAQPQAEPAKPLPDIYYMRDNHTFRSLSDNVETALIEIEQEFNAGHTHGMLCSKRRGFKTVHAQGEKLRLKFFEECREVLESQPHLIADELPGAGSIYSAGEAQPATQPRKLVALTDEQIEEISRQIERSDFFDCVVPFARAIESAHGITGGGA